MKLSFPAMLSLSTMLVWMSFAPLALADGPADNQSETVRPIPPPGVALVDEQTSALRSRCSAIRAAWDQLVADAVRAADAAKPWQQSVLRKQAADLQALTAEVLVFPRAVELAMEFNQFYKPVDHDDALSMLDEAERRIAVATQNPAWSAVVGISEGASQKIIIGGYRSKIDGSYQPYTMVVPAGYSIADARPRRLDIWFHGRGETLSEVNFLSKGRTTAGQYTPADTFVLHPYGRYSNAFKFAGEIDVLEALEHVRSHVPVDSQLISVRGFSMGGAACWQFATHYADRFFAANPGAGFSETPEFLKTFQGEDLSTTPEHQRRLWRLYDCTYWSRNLVHCPTVAYSGEKDRQKQAADVMERTLAEQGIELVHIIGPDTEHKIHEDSKLEIERRMNALASAHDRRVPMQVAFTTQTLRYHQMHWVDVQGLGQHWHDASVLATLRRDGHRSVVDIQTDNVTRLRLDFESGEWPLDLPARPVILVDGNEIAGPAIRSDRSWTCEIDFRDGRWGLSDGNANELRKRPGLQGPIDDAFMDSFLFVLPSGHSDDAAFDAWVAAESQHAQTHWRKHFRGDLHVVIDRELTREQIATNHLVMFGDPKSNSAIARIADAFPVIWTDDQIKMGDRTYDRAGQAVAMVYPNPLQPDRYVVLNSGFTFREYDYLNNARQTPKLPDWAIIDIRGGATTRDPGKITECGFFNENWKP